MYQDLKFSFTYDMKELKSNLLMTERLQPSSCTISIKTELNQETNCTENLKWGGEEIKRQKINVRLRSIFSVVIGYLKSKSSADENNL